MLCSYDPYILPTINFVGGESKTLIFDTYYENKSQPCVLRNSTSEFAIIDFINRSGSPILRKPMSVLNEDDGTSNSLTVNLLPDDTVKLEGKYVYQISIKDGLGNVEIPQQGLMYISNNINRGFI